MNTIQIVCIIGAMLMSFIIGRATKRFKIPIMGALIFKDDVQNPSLLFKCNKFDEIKKYKYIAIKIESRQNQSM